MLELSTQVMTFDWNKQSITRALGHITVTLYMVSSYLGAQLVFTRKHRERLPAYL